MPTPLDLDQLRTFAAIVDSGSFTKAADSVHKTQSAVSMQMRRLEERIGRPLFMRDGRNSKLTEDGSRLLLYAQRILRLSDETLAAFDEKEIAGRVRLGTPDDYADRFLPEILARFARSNPRAEVTVVCEPTPNLVQCLNGGHLDLAIITHVPEKGSAEIIRREPLFWVTSQRHCVHEEDPLPLAVGRPSCDWRKGAVNVLADMDRSYRVLLQSWSSNAVAAAVLAGLAVSVLPESALRPGMRILTERDGFPQLPLCEIGLIWGETRSLSVVNALAEHIVSSLDNLSLSVAAE